jgi:hypothetical protein
VLKPHDIAGQRFGRWVALKRTGYRNSSLWLCRCDCSAEHEVALSNLRSGASTRCDRCRRDAQFGRRNPHRVPDAERGCQRCKRSTLAVKSNKVRECGTCERRAHRNGRDAEGRPISKKRGVSSC